ncbi:MAG TPA: DUF6049 family protein [Acidimicrobiales bacterium]|nr:DUF6049 family protein [Acidimicrobiales bacterium]
MPAGFARAALATLLLVGSYAASAFSQGGSSAIAVALTSPPNVQPVVVIHPPARPNISRGADALQLLDETPWLGPGPRQFQMDLKVTTNDPADEELEVVVYGRLTARSQFQAALGGAVSGPFYDEPLALSKLPNDPRGGLDVNIPVNKSTGPGALPIATTGVYPVEAFLQKAGVRTGQPLITFIVYAGKDASNLQRLDVALIAPFGATVPISPTGSIGRVPASTAAKLEADASDLARSPVPVTIRADVPALEALARGKGRQRAAVSHLRKAAASGDELLPSTDLPLDVAELVSSGLTNDLASELTAGDAALGDLLGVAPSPSTWAFSGDIGSTSMGALAGLGAQYVAVPESDLSGLPAADQELTFAQPTRLSVQATDIHVVGADSELSERIGEAAARGEAVLVADQVLAELAMIDLETPSVLRGVVLLAPPHTALDPVFLSVLLAGLQDNPLLRAVPLREIFQDVPLAHSGTTGTLVRQLEGPDETTPLGGAGQLQRALGAVTALGEVYGDTTPLVSGLSQDLVVSLSSVFSGSRRSALIAGALQVAKADLHKVHLPPSISITLTSGQGRLPVTLVSTAGLPVHVVLVLTSEQLRFVTARVNGGGCSSVNAGSEDCQLTLSHPTTSLQIPVVVRTPGAFPLLLAVETPSGEVLATSTDTVRSTAIGDVAVVLMVGAALFLAVWWARNARHGRRARRLVPKPPDDDQDDGGQRHGPEGPFAVAPGAGLLSGGSRVEP